MDAIARVVIDFVVFDNRIEGMIIHTIRTATVHTIYSTNVMNLIVTNEEIVGVIIRPYALTTTCLMRVNGVFDLAIFDRDIVGTYFDFHDGNGRRLVAPIHDKAIKDDIMHRHEVYNSHRASKIRRL